MTTPDRFPPITDEQRERLSAYADGMLSAFDRQALEAELGRDPALKRELDSLTATRDLLRSLPDLRAPRDLRLTPAMVSRQPTRVIRFPVSAALSAAAAFILIVSGILSLPTGSPALPAAAVTSQSVGALVTPSPVNTQPIATATAALRATETSSAIQAVTAEIMLDAASGADGIAAEEPSDPNADQALAFGLFESQVAGAPESAAAVGSTVEPSANLAADAAPAPGSDSSRTTTGADAEAVMGAAAMGGAASSMMQATAPVGAVMPPAVAQQPLPTLGLPTSTRIPTDTPTPAPSETPLPPATATMPPSAAPTSPPVLDDAVVEARQSDPTSQSPFPIVPVALIALGVVLGGVAIVLLLRARR